jgi:GrpB-like predicted nucleotidyltransferase (UPF0157 family)
VATEADFEPVKVVEYDPAWPELYERERDLIGGSLGDLVAAIEHVGSTAVPGLGAKPIIDMMIGLRGLVDGEACVGPLEELGYEYKGEFGIPGRLYFRKIVEGKRRYQIHMVEAGSDFWERHLLFRDYLRGHPDEAVDYYELKVRLAAEFGTDREGYTEAKTEFIRSMEAKARGTPSAMGQASACRQPEG